MKKQLLLGILSIFFLSSFAQEKTALTKEETINYLSKKASEVKNNKRTANDGNTRYMLEHTIRLSSENVVVYFKRSTHLESPRNDCSYYYQENLQTFNPAHILEITDEGRKSGEVLGAVKIKLISKTGNSKWEMVTRKGNGYPQASALYCDCCQSKFQPTFVEPTEYIYITYLSSDPSNFNKIKKALEHLRDLYKAEDDPFGE
jgi:hypothetical protein